MLTDTLSHSLESNLWGCACVGAKSAHTRKLCAAFCKFMAILHLKKKTTTTTTHSRPLARNAEREIKAKLLPGALYSCYCYCCCCWCCCYCQRGSSVYVCVCVGVRKVFLFLATFLWMCVLLLKVIMSSSSPPTSSSLLLSPVYR